eukprot:TRINITY_DN534_c0_g3_i5.p1 TRINITY_DN534_c0_g3~~TRINITY_DN534_c0_g3_i5.p1  ORF type:complete len:296 (+),score=76.67 TRINITY_DN534_c0_g3_i5:81-890(+)
MVGRTKVANTGDEEDVKGVRAVVGYLQPTEELIRRLEKAYAVAPGGKWQLTCTLYLSTKASKQLFKQLLQQNATTGSPSTTTPSNPTATPTSLEKELYVFWFETEAPQKYFLVSKNVILETEPELLSIIIHNSKLYEKRQLFQVKGNQYTIGDMTVRTGTVTHNTTSNKAWVVEVEYKSCIVPNKADDILQEFISLLNEQQQHTSLPLSTQSVVNVECERFGLPTDAFTLRHSVFQFISLFQRIGLLKTPAPSSSSTSSSSSALPTPSI